MNNIEKAGKMIGLDLSKPIDCSQMNVWHIVCEPNFNSYHLATMLRKVKLEAEIINEYGENEVLTIEFELKSPRTPPEIKELV